MIKQNSIECWVRYVEQIPYFQFFQAKVSFHEQVSVHWQLAMQQLHMMIVSDR